MPLGQMQICSAFCNTISLEEVKAAVDVCYVVIVWLLVLNLLSVVAVTVLAEICLESVALLEHHRLGVSIVDLDDEA